MCALFTLMVRANVGLFFFVVVLFCLFVCLKIHLFAYLCGAHRGQKMSLELQRVVSCQVGALNQSVSLQP